ncbi:hypothetical protein VU02_01900 [Desulfobulbus sp. N2]|nr:hypothetical protein [Desulfobulbus sp. US4]MCW5204667.1 hypothetical protein [Desulfobulbus sp. N2]WLE98833.1 MAG: hypothetical protein QTN59_08320 [Candidatus Electrothrix communis]
MAEFLGKPLWDASEMKILDKARLQEICKRVEEHPELLDEESRRTLEELNMNRDIKNLPIETDTEECKIVLLSLISKIIDWNTRHYYRKRVIKGYEFTAENDRKMAGNKSLGELEKEFLDIVKQHCTQRMVREVTPKYYWRESSGFHYIEERNIVASRVAPGRIRLTCDMPRDYMTVKAQYFFDLFKEKDKWLIDYISYSPDDMLGPVTY